jgi:hypothetical protein
VAIIYNTLAPHEELAMLVTDYVLLGLAVVGLVSLIAFSVRARIIVTQSVLHPSSKGFMAIWDDEVAYFRGDPPLRTEPDPEPPADSTKRTRQRMSRMPEAEKLGDAGTRKAI